MTKNTFAEDKCEKWYVFHKRLYSEPSATILNYATDIARSMAIHFIMFILNIHKENFAGVHDLFVLYFSLAPRF